MERSHFATVKEAFAADPDASILALGITPRKGRNAEWSTIDCPCCTDSDGSCSIAKATGFINCKQCGRRLDLFEWWRETKRCADDWEACQQVGEKLGVQYQPPKKRKGKAPGKMTTALLDVAIHNLMEDPEAEWARKHFKDRRLWEPKILARFGVGFLDGSIIFAQWNPDGSIRDRYRRYNPHAKVKWGWSSGSGAPIGFWPAVPELPSDCAVLLCEGEMDVLAAWIIGALHRRSEPIAAFTWTGGAGSPLASALFPPKFPGLPVFVCYDNDTWQGGVLEDARAPTQKKLRDLQRRRSTMLKGVVGKLQANHCKVTLLHVDIDPVDNFGADLRDWLTAGRKFEELPRCDADQIKRFEPKPDSIAFTAVGSHAGELVQFQASVSTIENHQLTVPVTSTIRCPIGTKNCCRDCPVMRDFFDQEIEWSDHRDHLFNALLSRDPEAHIIHHMLGKPRSCNECRIEHEETVVGSHWCAGAGDEGDGFGGEMVQVISMEPPALSGQVGITGHAVHGTKSVGVFATSLEQLDKPEPDLDRHHNDLLMICPWAANNEAKIEEYVSDLVADYANNITQIYGRPELHIGVLLVAHSALFYELDGHRFRAWLDACFFGGPRRGKSETVKRLFEYWKLGTAFTCMENFSRAGLTIGGAENGMRMRPGLFPKNNRKLLFLDEFHHMTGGPRDSNVMVYLQSARDEGKVSALKVYGDLKLQAAVRLITAGNYANRSQRTYQYLCQHLSAFYGVPEALARMDFAWCVHDNVKMIAEEVEHKWTAEMSRTLILRAWAMEPHQIHFDDGVVDYTKKVAMEWDDIYASDDLALHTGIEKHHSLLRIAIAIANICYSHPEGQIADCRVRMGHARWAVEWMVQCWENLQYDEFSSRRIAARTVTQPFHVEVQLTVMLGLQDPEHASVILSRLTEANRMASLQGFVLGCGQVEEPRHFVKWLSTMMRYSAIAEVSANQYHIQYVPTEGCLQILRRLIALARDDPEQYAERQRKLSHWSNSPEATSNVPGIGGDPDIIPFDTVESDDDDEAVPF